MDVLEARELLVQMKVASYPYMKDNDREAWHCDVSKIAYPVEDEPAVTVADGDALNAMQGVFCG